MVQEQIGDSKESGTTPKDKSGIDSDCKLTLKSSLWSPLLPRSVEKISSLHLKNSFKRKNIFEKMNSTTYVYFELDWVKVEVSMMARRDTKMHTRG